MKRSDLLELIRLTIKLTGNHFCDDGRDQDAAEQILSLVEGAGMLPPYSGKVKQQDIVDRWSIATGETETVRVLVNEWEPE